MKSRKKVAILQSNYIPWKGYFDIIHMVDEFILYDDVQYTKNDWRNRNKIVTKDGLIWLSIPVLHTGKFSQKIRETKVIDGRWADKHWRSIEYSYSQGGGAYLSGPAAKDYIRENLFAEEGIALEWMDYSGYPEYPQTLQQFEHGVSVLDLIFHKGPEAKNYMKSFGI